MANKTLDTRDSKRKAGPLAYRPSRAYWFKSTFGESEKENTMTSYPQIWMAQEHYWDLRREAELERLIHQAGPTQTAVWHGRALAWLGGRLIAWGSGLQMRYSTPATR